MPAEPFGWLCPLVHLPMFSFRWRETVFLGQDQGHVPQESTSVTSLPARWERGVKGLLIYGWKVSGLLIRHCLEVRLKSWEQQFAPWQTACFSVLLMLRWANASEQGGAQVAQPCRDVDAQGGYWCHSLAQSSPTLHPSCSLAAPALLCGA